MVRTDAEKVHKQVVVRKSIFQSQTCIPEHIARSTVSATVYSFPKFEPLYSQQYPSSHLHLPLRKDLLHKAVVYEADNERGFSTAATKHRFEIRGSKRKLRPQKGTGRARLGDRSSPMLVGGGRAFDKKPRDFSTDLPRKMYDIAWRTALSYRYRKGQLIVVDHLDFEPSSLWITGVLERLGWNKENGKSLFVTRERSSSKNPVDTQKEHLRNSGQGALETMDAVDIRDILKLSRVVIEKRALDWILSRRQTDLLRKGWVEPWRQ